MKVICSTGLKRLALARILCHRLMPVTWPDEVSYRWKAITTCAVIYHCLWGRVLCQRNMGKVQMPRLDLYEIV